MTESSCIVSADLLMALAMVRVARVSVVRMVHEMGVAPVDVERCGKKAGSRCADVGAMKWEPPIPITAFRARSKPCVCALDKACATCEERACISW